MFKNNGIKTVFFYKSITLLGLAMTGGALTVWLRSIFISAVVFLILMFIQVHEINKLDI